mmetsp:Transcript_37288/g.81088  ORF Transcript_37288/g.81088 Transcript_37288/m.81088 type:complete len:290 (-) Transcript_37288:12-881(-)
MTIFLNSLVELGLPVVGAAKQSSAITLQKAPARQASTAASSCSNSLASKDQSAPGTTATTNTTNTTNAKAAATDTTNITATAATPTPNATTTAASSAPLQELSDDSIQAVEKAMAAKAQDLGLTSAQFKAVDPCYYDQELEWRRDVLGANSVDELCKSVIMENTKLAPDAEPGRLRCVLVVVQYVAKLNKERLIKAVQAIEASRNLPALGKKQYNMRLLEGETCAKMTGFEHNAVTPLGLDIPIVLSDKIAELPSGHFWLGGGHVDLKLRLDVKEVTEKLNAVVADVTG